jgi:glyoxylase-like metal-dependent hydrolase (beta-lactamase superfamily II)
LTSFLAKEQQGRTYVVEFADHLVAIDAPLSSALGERILATIREHFPTKPIRYVLFGHFHPHYTGGLRAFMTAGARVVAPAGCARFAAEIAKRSFILEPDAWARAGREAEIDTFEGSRVFEDSTRRLEAIDIGKSSRHTEEYVVFLLTRTHTLVQDDIGWYAAKDGKATFGAGSRGLYDALAARKLEVATMWQSWPVDHPRPSISWSDFERGVKSAH